MIPRFNAVIIPPPKALKILLTQNWTENSEKKGFLWNSKSLIVKSQTHLQMEAPGHLFMIGLWELKQQEEQGNGEPNSQTKHYIDSCLRLLVLEDDLFEKQFCI